jgi:hypothetical protein
MLAARNREEACQHTVPMAGMARKGTDSNAPMVEMCRESAVWCCGQAGEARGRSR